jgi:hypothetical protein
MRPLDALCELIDNAIDGFASARRIGTPIAEPTIIVDLPTRSTIEDRRQGRIVVRDNGPGMDQTTAERALKAGYSGNNPYDSLGLFGMGFNISTGKLGRRTVVTSSRSSDNDALEIVLDLDDIQRRRSFQVPFKQIPKPDAFNSGTAIEVSGWWPIGDANANFPLALVQNGLPRIRQELGRRYATILRAEGSDHIRPIRLIINGEPAKPFEHCVWGDDRYVERHGGKIYAVRRFNELLEHSRRCEKCSTILPLACVHCSECGCGQTRTVEERVRGWVGIQRYEHPSDFGIDLIRNGRAIRVAEKEAFFEFRDGVGNVTKDYPIDGVSGRIIGEVHIDHAPVDFLKQDFQRTSSEWAKAIEYLRGNTSLQPRRWDEGHPNESPISRLYQGFRRVRNYGRGDMYMGQFDPVQGKPTRISKDVESDLIRKFNERLPGSYPDDAEWWKHVEDADRQPIPNLIRCPNCQSENPEDATFCLSCSEVLRGLPCVNPECSKKIAIGTELCPHCQTAQTAEVLTPWICQVCNSNNVPGSSECHDCAHAKGTPNPLSPSALRADSDPDEGLSSTGLSIPLSDTSKSEPLEIVVRRVRRPMIASFKTLREQLPIVCFREVGRFEVFIDRSHPSFSHFGTLPETAVAFEIADYLLQQHSSLRSRHSQSHTLQSLASKVLRQRWGHELAPSTAELRDTAREVFDTLKNRLIETVPGRFKDILDVMLEEERREMMRRAIDRLPGPECGRVIDSARVLQFIPEAAIPQIIAALPGLVTEEKLIDTDWTLPEDVPVDLAAQHLNRRLRFLRSCLEDAAALAAESALSVPERRRAVESLSILRKLVQSD